MLAASNGNLGQVSGMSVTDLLGGEFPQLTQDGFMLIDGNISIGGSAPPLWAGWDSGGHRS